MLGDRLSAYLAAARAQGLEQAIDLRFGVCRGKRHSQPRAAFRHRRGPDRRDAKAGGEQLILRLQCALGATENQWLDRRGRGGRAADPSCAAPLRNRAVSSSTRSRRHGSRWQILSASRVRRRPAAATRSCRCRTAPSASGARSDRHCRRQTRRKLPSALPNVPTSTGTSSPFSPKCSQQPRPVLPITPKPVRIVDHQPGAVFAARQPPAPAAVPGRHPC